MNNSGRGHAQPAPVQQSWSIQTRIPESSTARPAYALPGADGRGRLSLAAEPVVGVHRDAARPDGGPWRARARHDPLSVPAGARRRHGGTHRARSAGRSRPSRRRSRPSVGSPTRESSGCAGAARRVRRPPVAPSRPRSRLPSVQRRDRRGHRAHLRWPRGLDGAEAAALETTLAAQLPVTTNVDRLTLLVEDDGGVWHAERSWPLG